MTKTTKRLRADNAALVIVDIQDRLLPKIPTAAGLVRNAGFLLRGVGRNMTASVYVRDEPFARQFEGVDRKA